MVYHKIRLLEPNLSCCYTLLMEIEKLLLTWDEYNQKGHFEIPYTYLIQGDNYAISYFGARHSFDPHDPQFEQIEKLWNEMTAHYPREQMVAVIEGGLMNNEYERDEYITRAGESGLLIYLAKKAGVEIKYFEPSKGLLNDLTQHYSKEEIFYHQMAQRALQWNKLTRKPNFEEYTIQFLKKLQSETDWDDFDFSMEHLKKIHTNIFATVFDESDRAFFQSIGTPTNDNTTINKISRDIDIVRDTAIVQGVLDEWQKGKSVFVVYGASHAVIQERALKALI